MNLFVVCTLEYISEFTLNLVLSYCAGHDRLYVESWFMFQMSHSEYVPFDKQSLNLSKNVITKGET